MKPLLFLLFLTIIPATAAFNCTYFANQTDCQAALAADEDLIAGLLYANTSHPGHDLVAIYNQGVAVTDAPAGYVKRQQGIIRDAWVALLTIQPSVIQNNTRYCPDDFSVRSETGYWIEVPPDYYNPTQSNGATCKILHSLYENTSTLTISANNRNVGTGKNVATTNLTEDATIKATLNIKGSIKNDYYNWQRYCCRRRDGYCIKYCYRCPYKRTDYTTNALTITDTTNTTYYAHEPNAIFALTSTYSDTTKGTLTIDDKTSVWLALGQSNYSLQQRSFMANFTKKPFYLLELHATTIDIERGQNLRWNNNAFYIPNATNCTLTSEDFFNKKTSPCTENYQAPPSAAFDPPTSTVDWIFPLKLAVFALIIIGFYRVAKKYLRKLPGLFIVLLLAIPLVSAEECGLTNLASCLPEKFFDFLLALINGPIEPLLNFVKLLLESSPSIELFHGVWAIVVYCLSMFYGFLFIFAGYQFLTSGHNVLKRELAKEWLKNTVIMITLVQASFYLYGLVANLGSLMTQAVLSLVDEHFFLLTVDNIVNVGLEFILALGYALVLFLTMLFLVMRYLIVAMGVLFAPIGLFCYFLPPLRSYGKLILNLLGLCIFVTFLDAIIILACSKLITIPLFANFKIVVMINCFIMVDIVFVILIKHAIAKAGLSDGADSISQAAKYIAMLA